MKYICTIGLVFLTLIFDSCIVDSCENYIERQRTIVSFSGNISKKFLNKKARYAGYITIGNNDFDVDHYVYEKILVNDSIVKNKGTLKHVVYRGDEIIELYPVCDGLMILDDTVISVR